MVSRPRCAYYKKVFKPSEQAPLRYCSAWHGQMAYAQGLANSPTLPLGKDFDDIRTKAGVDRAVLDLLLAACCRLSAEGRFAPRAQTSAMSEADSPAIRQKTPRLGAKGKP